jgi:Ca2+-binding RTX toxin-like protein
VIGSGTKGFSLIGEPNTLAFGRAIPEFRALAALTGADQGLRWLRIVHWPSGGITIGISAIRIRLLAALAAAAAIALWMPAPAQGAPSQAYVFDGDSLGVGPDNFGDQQAHNIKVTYFAGDYRATDTAGVVAGFGCNQVNPTTVSCPDVIAGVVPNGGAGDDTLEVESLGPGDESGIHGFRGNDRLIGSPGEDWVVGYAGNDILFGNGGPDRILGGPSQVTPDDDWIDGGPGPDYISGDSSTGGNSIDTVSYQNRPASEPIRVTLGKGLGDDGGASDGSGDTVEYIENVLGGAGNDFIQAYGTFEGNNDNKANIFRGGGGADVLISDEGPDRLFGDAGADRMLGGDQQDLLTGGPGADTMKGQGQKDHLFARDGTRDRRLDCGPGGRKESARRDRIDPAPISC